MNQFVQRMTGSALVVTIAALLFATPCAADAVSRPAAPSSITALSPASLQILRAAPAAARTQEGSAPTPGGFFKSRRGAVALGLVAAGVGFTVWSISHDRKPVRSPIR